MLRGAFGTSSGAEPSPIVGHIELIDDGRFETPQYPPD
jgi:hypothetical protein